MDDIIFLDEEDDYEQNHHIISRNSLHPTSSRLIINKHLDKALEDINILLYEDVIELWKIYGES